MDWKNRYTRFHDHDRIMLLSDPVWKNESKIFYMNQGFVKGGIFFVRYILSDDEICIEQPGKTGGMITPKQFLNKV